MNDIKQFKDLFTSEKYYHIPNYQRPYSWEKEQVERLLLDLVEYTNRYYFGHFLFHKEDKNYNIIDGQQRLTTALIFILSVIHLVDKNPLQYPHINKDKLISEYIGNTYKKKLETHIGNDNSFLVNLLDLKIPEKFTGTSLAQEKMYQSFQTIITKLNKYTEEVVIKMIYTLTNSEISTKVISTRDLSNQVFIFHNSRGKALSYLENMKALFIERSYRLDPINKDNEDFIKNYIDTPFEKIYQLVHSINHLHFGISEDEIISYFFTLYYGKDFNKGFDFNDFESHLTQEPYLLNNRESIKLFVKKLHYCFITLQNILETAEKDNKIGNILALENNIHTITLLIAIFQSDIKENSKDFDRICKLIEIISFTKRFINKSIRTNYFYWLAQELANNKKNTQEIISYLEKYAVEGFKGYWEQQSKFQEYFREDNIIYQDFYRENKYFTRYLFWKYENYLRTKSNDASNPIYLKEFLKKKGDFGSIEHIYAQEPANGKKLDKDDTTNYVHNIGNLLIINLSDNISKSNDSVQEKYKDHLSLLQHHQELQKILKDEEKGLENYNFNWGKTPEDMKQVIEIRAKKISEFALTYFDINSTDTY